MSKKKAKLNRYLVTVPYWYTLSATVEANSEEEAIDKFYMNKVDSCEEVQMGQIDSYDVTVEEITK